MKFNKLTGPRSKSFKSLKYFNKLTSQNLLKLLKNSLVPCQSWKTCPPPFQALICQTWPWDHNNHHHISRGWGGNYQMVMAMMTTRMATAFNDDNDNDNNDNDNDNRPIVWEVIMPFVISRTSHVGDHTCHWLHLVTIIIIIIIMALNMMMIVFNM